MPLTLFAHQVPTMGLKMARPRWFDGTALCLGSMAPDLGYAVSAYLHVDTHDWDGMPLVLGLAAGLTGAADHPRARGVLGCRRGRVRRRAGMGPAG